MEEQYLDYEIKVIIPQTQLKINKHLNPLACQTGINNLKTKNNNNQNNRSPTCSAENIFYAKKQQLRKSKKEQSLKRKQLLTWIKEILQNLQDNIVQKPEQILADLKSIQKIANEYQLKDITDITVFSVLKERLQKLPEDIQTSTYKKWEIESPYRQSKIQSFNYVELEQKKLLNENTFIVFPYKWGKGFKPFLWGKGYNTDDQNDFRMIQQDRIKYHNALKYADYVQTINEVNDLIFQEKNQQENQINFKFSYESILFILTIISCILTIYFKEIDSNNFLYTFYITIIFSGLLMVIQMYLGIIRFKYRPVDLTQIELNVQKITIYFDKLNKMIQNDGSIQFKYRWECPNHFLYLQLKFMDGIPFCK